MTVKIYLDNNATTRPAPEVVTAMIESLREGWANPSSAHRAGQEARRPVELARESVCKLIGCRDGELVVTSGGTEAANLAIRGALSAQANRSILVTNRLEHATVRELAETLEAAGREVAWVPCDSRGLLDLNALEDLLDRKVDQVALVSVMWVNNETGVIQPIEEIGRMCRSRGVWFHTDATQGVGKMPLQVASLPIDLVTFSAHKFHGPKGIGGLYLRGGIRIQPQVIGGGQERGRRGGTENVAGIVGMGAAARLARTWLATNECAGLARLRDSFERRIVGAAGEATVNGADAPRLWSTSNIAFGRLEGEAILLFLSERGVYASAGAACASGSVEPSPVLVAMGLAPATVAASIRFSLCRHTTEQEIDAAIPIIAQVVDTLRATLASV